MRSGGFLEPATLLQPSRRRWLVHAAVGVVAGGIGFLCGWRVRGREPARPAVDRRLAWAREIARTAPPRELVDWTPALLQTVQMYGGDAVLWSAVERIASQVVEDPALPDRGKLAGRLLRAFANTPPPAHLDHFVPDLRRLAR